ncbi:MAG: hypothetical protein JW722_03770 [Demequinaceae bacterium]|nr:hypothetical protein [Demequinaceae bacterium]
MDVIRDAWPWVLSAFLLGVLCGWLVTRRYCRDRVSSKPAGFAAMPSSGPEELAKGSAVLGFKVRLNDLRAVEGIGPKIEKLMNDDGIRTWADLASAQVSHLERILDAAGHDYQMHVPTTWPQQARMLAEARWEEFKELTDRLKGGR